MSAIINWLLPPEMRNVRKSWASWLGAIAIWVFVIGAWFAVPMIWRAAVCSVAVCG